MDIERADAINPVFGMRITDKYDLCPSAYSEHELVEILNGLTETRHDYEMLMESASFEEVDSYYNPGMEEVPNDYILEAIVVDKFSKTERRMAAVVRTLNKHLGDSEINALEPVVGKPKKTGLYAYVTVQLPFSDGQVVSVIFHSPEGDKKKIGPSDQIIAFRWLLNKRDITQAVAPEDGSEISLETIAKRITQLVVKNSARFERTQKEAQAEVKELEQLREDLKTAEERQEKLIINMADTVKEIETSEAQLSNILALLEKQKTINAELRLKLDALRKSGQNNVNNADKNNSGNNEQTLTEVNRQTNVDTEERRAKRDQYLKLVSDVTGGKVSETEVNNQLNTLNIWAENCEDFKGESREKIFAALDNTPKPIASLPIKYLGHFTKTTDDPRVYCSEAYFVEHAMNSHPEIDPEEYKKIQDILMNPDETIKDTRINNATGKPRDNLIFVKKINGIRGLVIELSKDDKGNIIFHKTLMPTKEKLYPGLPRIELSSVDGVPTIGTAGINPAPGGSLSARDDNNLPTSPPFVNDLNEIIAGKYDNAYDQITEIIDKAVEVAEATDQFNEYEDIFNRALDHQIALRKKMREAL